MLIKEKPTIIKFPLPESPSLKGNLPCAFIRVITTQKLYAVKIRNVMRGNHGILNQPRITSEVE